MFVGVVIGDQRAGLHMVVSKKLARPACVFARYNVGLSENPQCARGDIFEIAYWGATENQSSAHSGTRLAADVSNRAQRLTCFAGYSLDVDYPVVMVHKIEHRTGWRTRDSVVLLAVTFVAALIRLVRLDEPPVIVFDETYYAKDACWYVTASQDLCGIEGEQTGIHPPLGKWLMAVGVKLFGYDAFGWRIAAAVAGVITVALLYVLARKLLRSTSAATLTAGLLAFDFLHFVQSRVAMLDVFVPMFGVAALLFLVYDRDRLIEGRSPAGLLHRRWRLAAGAAAGAAVASKWSGIFYVVLIILLTVVWEMTARREAAPGRWWQRTLREEGPSIFVGLVLVPVLIYVVSYAGRLEGEVLAAPWGDGSWVQSLIDRQDYMLSTHLNLEANHAYQSPAWSWILVKRPVSYFYEQTEAGESKEVLALGNPFVWWVSIAAMAFVAYRWIRRRDLRGPEGIILAGFIVNYLPWLAQPTDRPAVFIFYLLPTVPFMCLALGYVGKSLGRGWGARAALSVYGAIAIISFGYFYPVMADLPLARGAWDGRIWFESCDRAPATVRTSTLVETKRAATITRTELTTTEESPPTNGWCWI
jgi:dolichyl-phosphate-mannose-protein mannosyltransferase